MCPSDLTNIAFRCIIYHMNNNRIFAKQFPQIGAMAMAVVLFFCGTINVRAATELTLSRTSVTVTVGRTKKISVTGDYVKIKAKITS